jgi:lipopolysaccharide/colanic/teichoic acid biosynthesis glycosyltransferase
MYIDFVVVMGIKVLATRLQKGGNDIFEFWRVYCDERLFACSFNMFIESDGTFIE